MPGNRKPSGQDTWLTPPPLLLKALGAFDLDPCCPDTMPWSTARKMIRQPKDGLAAPWAGRVWCNPPYSDIMPWVLKLAEHRNGVLLVPAKSTDTRWGQLVLRTMDMALFLKGRLLFHYQDGTLSSGKWSPYLLAAYGQHNVSAISRARAQFPGVLLRRPR